MGQCVHSSRGPCGWSLWPPCEGEPEWGACLRNGPEPGASRVPGGLVCPHGWASCVAAYSAPSPLAWTPSLGPGSQALEGPMRHGSCEESLPGASKGRPGSQVPELDGLQQAMVQPREPSPLLPHPPPPPALEGPRCRWYLNWGRGRSQAPPPARRRSGRSPELNAGLQDSSCLRRDGVWGFTVILLPGVA